MYDFKKMEKSATLFLQAIGEDVNRAGLKETPRRVAELYSKLLDGYDIDVKKYIKLFKEEVTDNMVVVTKIPFYSFCEHHLTLFKGYISIGYVPRNNKVIGLSKLIRIMRVYAKRLQIQERITNQIAEVLHKYVSTHVMVYLEAEHYCMSIRGVRLPGTKTITTAVRGKFKTDEKIRNEFMRKIGNSNND